MEGLFDLIAKILPLVSFYPRWAQMLFTSSFLLFLLSLATFVIGYPSASTRKHQADVVASEETLSGDALRDIDANLKEVDSLFTDFGLALSGYYAASASVRLNLLDYTTANPDVRSYLEKQLTPGIQRDVQDMINKLAAIRVALAAIQRNRFSSGCWSRAVRRLQSGALARIRQSLLAHGFTQGEATIDPADLSALQQFLSLAERRLGEFTFAPLLAAVLATNSADVPAVGKTYDNAGLRTFVFSGNVLFAFVTQSKANPAAGIVVSWGSALLLDMYACMPTADIVRAELADRYRAAARAVGKLELAVGAGQAVSSDFRIAASELEKRQELLFLELPA